MKIKILSKCQNSHIISHVIRLKLMPEGKIMRFWYSGGKVTEKPQKVARWEWGSKSFIM